MKLTDHQVIYIDKLWRDMREAVAKFREFDAKWNQLNDALKLKMDLDRQFDPVMRDRTIADNLELAGYLNGAAWWRDKAAMLASVIQAEKSAIEMTGGGAGWEPSSPLPSRYGRASSSR